MRVGRDFAFLEKPGFRRRREGRFVPWSWRRDLSLPSSGQLPSCLGDGLLFPILVSLAPTLCLCGGVGAASAPTERPPGLPSASPPPGFAHSRLLSTGLTLSSQASGPRVCAGPHGAGTEPRGASRASGGPGSHPVRGPWPRVRSKESRPGPLQWALS